MNFKTIPPITNKMINRALKIALRTGKYFKLPPVEKAILWLSAKIVKVVKNPTLREILLNIFEKINEKLTLKIKAYMIGVQIAQTIINTAKKIGYKNIKTLLKPDYIFYLGISYLNTPTIWKTP